jgi:CBS domain-containing protein
MAIRCVRELMTSDPACCTPQTPITEAAQLMLTQNCGALPVVENEEGRRLVGMITDRDIVCRIVASRVDPSASTVQQAMSGNLVCIGPDASISECVQSMAENQLRRMPIVDRDGRVVGIVAQADLARASAQQRDLETELADMVEEVSESEEVRAGSRPLD